MNVTQLTLLLCGGAWIYEHYSSAASQSTSIYRALRVLYIAGVAQLLWQIIGAWHVLSPLRNIPKAKVDWRSWPRDFLWEPDGSQLLALAKRTPHLDYLRYTGVRGLDRLLIMNLEAAHDVLSKQAYANFPRPKTAQDQLERLIGKGLIWAEGDLHKQQKRKVHPAFGHKTIISLYPIFWRKFEQTAAAIEKSLNSDGLSPDVKTTIDLQDWSARCLLDLIGIAVWGIDFDTIGSAKTPYYEGPIYRVQERQRFVNLSTILPTWVFGWLYPRSLQTVRNIYLATRTSMTEGIRRQREKPDEAEHNVLKVLLQSGLFTDEELLPQLHTMLVAGHQTTAGEATFAFYELARRPEIQAKLREEVKSVLGDGQVVDETLYDTLNKMEYLKAFVNEVLRYWPVLGAVFRQNTTKTTIGDLTIPAGTICVMSPLVLNHSKSIWGEDADKFDPNRWLKKDDSSNSAPHPASKLMTFSVGPKSCIGEDFARGELLAWISIMVSKFHIELEDPEQKVELFWAISAKPIETIRFNLREL